jgi:mRNA interferase MazF
MNEVMLNTTNVTINNNDRLVTYPNNNTLNQVVKRGDIWEVTSGVGIGSEQFGDRPAIIIQNDMGNLKSPTVIIAYITSKMSKAKLPTHVEIARDEENHLDKDSLILLEQIRTIDKKRLKMKIGRCVDETILEKVNEAAMVSIGIKQPERKQSNYPIPNRGLQQEVFDFTKAKRISRTLNELERRLNEYKSMNKEIDLFELKTDIKAYRYELEDYCKKFNKDYTRFYTPIEETLSGGSERFVRAI